MAETGNNAVFVTATMDDTYREVIRYTLLSQAWRLLDSAGETGGRTLLAGCVETVLNNIPLHIKGHDLAPLMRRAIETDRALFISFADPILFWPRIEEHGEEEWGGITPDERRNMAIGAFGLLQGWLNSLKPTPTTQPNARPLTRGACTFL